MQQDNSDFFLPTPPPAAETNPTPAMTAVLGKHTLPEVWSDKARTILPSWISPIPAGAGSAKTGKLTADQWRTLCTVHLVVTLVRLWGGCDPDDRRCDLLVNFMHLVTATSLLFRRSVDTETIQLYEESMKAYLEGHLHLYPHLNLSPKHHLSLHMPGFLRGFGPVHGWVTWGFERLILKFQNTDTNRKIGMNTPHLPHVHLSLQTRAARKDNG